ncbi:MAG: imidazoleglycerol-phosphate dehydratase HisB [Treponema sp.]|jgi:imidazoleglycerol-phosphate dehydratase|nr:imidazoleglycerol-phosphate dehydratase HisB [Treponema sp.]
MRETVLERKTNETAIKIEINLDRKDKNNINTGIGFFDHMLELFAFRAGITLNIECKGDLAVDGHHTVEDAGIVLGQAISKALGDKSGINRYGEATIPMDESLANCILDISGRQFLVFNAKFPSARAGEFETELAEEFFRALAFNSGITLHINRVYGKNTHHMIEAIFKAAGCAFGRAIGKTGEGVPSTKGVL